MQKSQAKMGETSNFVHTNSEGLNATGCKLIDD